jgi:hypothetical protein
MKKALVILAAATFIFALPSCKKCSTCKYTYNDGAGSSATFTYPEQCGKKKDIDNYETACKNAATLVGGTCTCS